MTKLPQFVRSRLALRQTASDEHPDADLLAAFATQTVSSRARADLGITAPAHGLYLEHIEHRIPLEEVWP